MQALTDWVGRSQTLRDTFTPVPARALAATLDRDEAGQEHWPAGTPLPPLWHWLYFLPLARASEIGPDGHARRGGFLPPVPLPRRMWAGSRFEFHDALRIGEAVTRASTIERVEEKSGRSGALVFVTVRHEFRREGAAAPALTEWHDIVYREAPPAAGVAAGTAAGAVAPAQAAPGVVAPAGAWQRTLVPDDVLLFRYSALTFNGHRIHYDRQYVTQCEGYPGLVVHGPLIATLLLDLLRREAPAAEVAAFQFRALRPCFDGRPLALHGQPVPGGVRLWATDDQGAAAMDAEATLRV